MANILVIDPSRSMRNTLKERLEYEGHAVEVAEDTISGMTVYANRHFDLLLCGQPDSPLRTSTPWIRLSHDSSPESAVLAMQQGAVDFVTKPINMNRLLDAVRKGLAKTPAAVADAADEAESVPEEVVPVRRVRAARSHVGRIVGESVPVKRLNTLIDKVAPTDARVLIMGANGTGKELVARWLHEKSRRRDGPFVEVNCAAIPSELIESELFGHKKGSFTDAHTDRAGKFEAAHEGTLFLDEIGNLPYHLQSKLLTAIQSRSVVRVGSNEPIPVNIRLICATNCNLEEMVAKGKFREDLLYRINTIHIEIPPLRERKEDIIPLAERFIDRFCKQYDKGNILLSTGAQEKLRTYPWYGNIRELEHAVEKAVIINEDGILSEEHFHFPRKIAAPATETSVSTLEEMELQMIQKAIEKCNGNLSAVAAQLGITRQTLYNKMKKFGL